MPSAVVLFLFLSGAAGALGLNRLRDPRGSSGPIAWSPLYHPSLAAGPLAIYRSMTPSSHVPSLWFLTE